MAANILTSLALVSGEAGWSGAKNFGCLASGIATGAQLEVQDTEARLAELETEGGTINHRSGQCCQTI